MAKLGYRYEEALELPVWLFWELVDVERRERVRDQADMFKAVAMAFGGFDKPTAKGITKDWNEALQKGYIKPPAPVRTLDERQKIWERKAAQIFG